MHVLQKEQSWDCGDGDEAPLRLPRQVCRAGTGDGLESGLRPVCVATVFVERTVSMGFRIVRGCFGAAVAGPAKPEISASWLFIEGACLLSQRRTLRSV